MAGRANTKSANKKGAGKTRKFTNGENEDEGVTPADVFLDQVTNRLTDRKMQEDMYSKVIEPATWNSSTFEEWHKNHKPERPVVPIFEMKHQERIALPKIEGATGPEANTWIHAHYVQMDRQDYILAQSVFEEEVVNFWRMVYQDDCPLVVCLLAPKEFSTTDRKLCFPYWPKTAKDNIVIGKDLVKVEFKNKKEAKQWVIYDLQLMVNSGPKEKEADGEDDPGNVVKSVTLYHYTEWADETYPDPTAFGDFVKIVSTRLAEVNKTPVNEYYPPLILQSHSTLHRASTVLALITMCGDIDRRDGFDPPAVALELARYRPGALSARFSYLTFYAVSIRLAIINGWHPNVQEAEHFIKNLVKPLDAEKDVDEETDSDEEGTKERTMEK
ncbi:hypothetical protein L596_022122 [Steinernema carpocapsae]|uniref:Tyrosine-protein phosphatase domain-containing protein n=1 Tax=Steinernema carpocapsae TaxID=34508 RepID=A0A4U5MLM7_STECR|nr:hypothetical protein L596_022122 [Steinernema carpocapsae]